MQTYSKFDSDIPCGLRVITFSITANRRTDRQTDSHNGYSGYVMHTCRSCNFVIVYGSFLTNIYTAQQKFSTDK